MAVLNSRQLRSLSRLLAKVDIAELHIWQAEGNDLTFRAADKTGRVVLFRFNDQGKVTNWQAVNTNKDTNETI